MFAPESVTIERASRRVEVTEREETAENAYTRRVSSASYANRSTNTPWTTSEIDEFYRALRKCGTNFLMIASMLPGRDRNQVLRLYKKELKSHPERIEYATTHPMSMSEEDVNTLAPSNAQKPAHGDSASVPPSDAVDAVAVEPGDEQQEDEDGDEGSINNDLPPSAFEQSVPDEDA